MEIQNFRFYLQDATNFFSVLDYTFMNTDEYKPVKRSFLNWFYDPIKTNEKRFIVGPNTFTVRSVVNKADAHKTLVEVFDAVVRYYTFQKFDNLKLQATQEKNRIVLKAFLDGKLYTLAEVNLILTRSKAVIQSIVFEGMTFSTFCLFGITHKEEDEEDGDVADPIKTSSPAVVSMDENLDLSKRYCFDEFMGDDQPSNRVIKTGNEIIQEYFPYWSEQMIAKFGPDDSRINFKNCIDDYCVVNWAWEIDGNGNKI